MSSEYLIAVRYDRMKGEKLPMKRTIALLMSVLILLSLSVSGFAAPIQADAQSAAAQVKLIFSNFSTFTQSDASVWSYAVTDLDHNGQLELLAASIQGDGRYVALKAWEVSPDGKSLNPCHVHVPQGGSFPDLITASADTFYNSGNDTWYYLFDDTLTVSATQVITSKCSVQKKGDTFEFTTYATRHMSYQGNQNISVFTDASGKIITPEAYNAAGVNALASAARSSTSFDWFLASEVSEDRLTNSYGVFSGTLMPSLTADAGTAIVAFVPMSTSSVVAMQNTVLMVTKQPTNEFHKAGETALFIANANVWSSVEWTFVAPEGGEYSAQSFSRLFPQAALDGYFSSNLSIEQVSTDMNGWSVYATFYTAQNTQTVRTASAYLYVSDSTVNTKAISSGAIAGVVTGLQADKLTVSLTDGSTVDVPRSICSVIYGDLTTGSTCTVYYHGGKASASNIWHVDVNGSMTTYTVTYYEYYCPNCHHSVSPNAEVCPYCGYSFTSSPSYHYYCPSCYGEVPADVDICPYCGYIFATGAYMQDGTAWLHYGEIITEDDDDDLGSGYRTYGVPITDGYDNYGSGFLTYGVPITDGGDDDDDLGSGYRTYGVPITDGYDNYGSGFLTYGVPITDGGDDDDYGSGYHTYGVPITDGSEDYGSGYHTYGVPITDGSEYYDYDYEPYDFDDFD